MPIKKEGFIIGIIIGLIIVILILGFTNNKLNRELINENNEKSMTTALDDFASCLKNKGIKYYHSFECPHCKQQDELFNSAKQYLNLIECGALSGEDWEICSKDNVHSVPMWIMPNGERLQGIQTLKTLSEKSGCKLLNVK
jgi:hypothetical protein